MKYSELVELLDYNPRTGRFTWRQRGREWFVSDVSWRRWNTKYAGKPALTADQQGYKAGTVLGKRYLAHRIAWFFQFGSWPKNQIDHINGDRSDNRIQNLRDVTQAENRKNNRLYATNTSGHAGVDFMPKKGRWRARIGSEHLGVFRTKSEAILARKKAELQHAAI